jgi:hypothetical protein
VRGLDILSLAVLGCHVRVQCQDPKARTLLALNYSHLRRRPEAPDVVYTVGREWHRGACVFRISRGGQEALRASTDGEFLFLFEKDMTVELQKLRRDLYFVHGAVLEFAGHAFMLVGASGSGKSTTTWALLHHGFGYFSDELAPVDLQTLDIHPYPHALCLKDTPPSPYMLPEKTLYTSRSLHVPVEDLPSGAGTRPAPLRAIFFSRYRPEASAPALRPISSAEAATRLFANTLNALAHPGDGLDGAVAIATRTSSFALCTADLPATCALVKTTLERLYAGEESDGPAQR